jgi:hypothetical protein
LKFSYGTPSISSNLFRDILPHNFTIEDFKKPPSKFLIEVYSRIISIYPNIGYINGGQEIILKGNGFDTSSLNIKIGTNNICKILTANENNIKCYLDKIAKNEGLNTNFTGIFLEIYTIENLSFPNNIKKESTQIFVNIQYFDTSYLFKNTIYAFNGKMKLPRGVIYFFSKSNADQVNMTTNMYDFDDPQTVYVKPDHENKLVFNLLGEIKSFNAVPFYGAYSIENTFIDVKFEVKFTFEQANSINKRSNNEMDLGFVFVEHEVGSNDIGINSFKNSNPNMKDFSFEVPLFYKLSFNFPLEYDSYYVFYNEYSVFKFTYNGLSLTINSDNSLASIYTDISNFLPISKFSIQKLYSYYDSDQNMHIFEQFDFYPPDGLTLRSFKKISEEYSKVISTNFTYYQYAIIYTLDPTENKDFLKNTEHMVGEFESEFQNRPLSNLNTFSGNVEGSIILDIFHKSDNEPDFSTTPKDTISFPYGSSSESIQVKLNSIQYISNASVVMEDEGKNNYTYYISIKSRDKKNIDIKVNEQYKNNIKYSITKNSVLETCLIFECVTTTRYLGKELIFYPIPSSMLFLEEAKVEPAVSSVQSNQKINISIQNNSIPSICEPSVCTFTLEENNIPSILSSNFDSLISEISIQLESKYTGLDSNLEKDDFIEIFVGSQSCRVKAESSSSFKCIVSPIGGKNIVTAKSIYGFFKSENLSVEIPILIVRFFKLDKCIPKYSCSRK